MRFLLFAMLLVSLACAVPLQRAEKAQRQPLQKSGFVLKSPQYEPRVIGYDEKTGTEMTYDHKPRIELVDGKAGKYALKWIGYNGKEQTIFYHLKDAVDVVISATVSQTPSGKYLYAYHVKSFPSSGIYVSTVKIQNFASDVQPVQLREGDIGLMSSRIKVFEKGNWVSFGFTYIQQELVPGGEIELRLLSGSPPGLVGCRVRGGPLTLQDGGHDEGIPTVLEAALPGYEVLPRGYTVGPVDHLKPLSSVERAKYVVNLLPQLRQLGWITEDAARWYEQNLKGNNLDSVQKRAEQDLKAERITSEVFAMIEAIN